MSDEDLSFLTVEVAGLEAQLFAERALFLPELAALIVSDIHLGKAETFARHGSGIPSTVHLEDLTRLTRLLERTKAVQLTIVGDLFHSRAKSDWGYFSEWRLGVQGIPITLIRGNHDVMPEGRFNELGVSVQDELVYENRIRFLHDPCKRLIGLPPGLDAPGTFDVCGHLHPAVRLPGAIRTRDKLPCFWIRRNDLILPAFGGFTGSSAIKALPGQQIYAISESKIMKLP